MDAKLLANIPLFAQLSPDEMAGLANLLERKEVPANQTVVWIGETGNYFAIIQSGQVEVVQPDEKGREVTLNMIAAGGFFGELSLLDGGPRTATVRTTRDTVLLTLGREDFLRFLRKHPSAAIHLLSEQGKRQREILQMLRGIEDPNQVIQERLTAGQRFADSFASLMGSWTFIVIQTIIFFLWITLNLILANRPEGWDPYPFNLLNLLLAAIAGYAAPIIMMSQARQSEKDRIRAELEYQVNVKAQHEVMHLHQKIDHLAELLRRAQKSPGGDDVGR